MSKTNGRVASINLSTLVEDWVEHPTVYEDYADQCAAARETVNLWTDRLKVVEAEAELDVRDHPKRFRLSLPIREAAVKLKVTLHPDVQKARRVLNRKKHVLNVLEGKLKSLEHRKRALESLVSMGKMNWFKMPTGDEEAREIVRERRKSKTRNKSRVK